MQEKRLGIVDCNNFYVSCERVFNPKLRNKPVVVLSSNDGCVVARSNEAKALGIPMGVPYFKVKDEFARNNGVALSSNYTLYADMSYRVSQILESAIPQVENYSIDESFLQLDDFYTNNLTSYLSDLKYQIYMQTGIPVTFGIATTKTLAKVACRYAKKHPENKGVLNFFDCTQQQITEFLKSTEIEDIWGVGRQSKKKWNLLNVYNALSLKQTLQNNSQDWIRSKFTVQGLRTVLELNDVSCIDINENEQPKQSIASTRSFAKKCSKYQALEAAISYHASNIAEKLLAQNSSTSTIAVYIRTDPFNKNEKYYSNMATGNLTKPIFFTNDLVSNALMLLKRIYIPGLLYKKVGVFAYNIQERGKEQITFPLDLELGIKEKAPKRKFVNGYKQDLPFEYRDSEIPSPNLYEKPDDNVKANIKNISDETKVSLMHTVQRLNFSYGEGTVKVGSAFSKNNDWKANSLLISKRYTSNWNELLEIKI
jgi:DNA polymerase V